MVEISHVIHTLLYNYLRMIGCRLKSSTTHFACQWLQYTWRPAVGMDALQLINQLNGLFSILSREWRLAVLRLDLLGVGGSEEKVDSVDIVSSSLPSLLLVLSSRDRCGSSLYISMGSVIHRHNCAITFCRNIILLTSHSLSPVQQ